MDITSFILGRKTVKTQEKTVTPGEEEIVVTPDTGFDALAKVIVEAVSTGGGSGDSAGYQYKQASVKTPASTAKGYRFEVNFGFQPDFILVHIGSQSARQTQVAHVYYGFSAAATELFGWSSHKNYRLSEGTNDWMYASNPFPIESDNDYNPIYNADPTGFNVGYKPATSTYYLICAFKFPL